MAVVMGSASRSMQLGLTLALIDRLASAFKFGRIFRRLQANEDADFARG